MNDIPAGTKPDISVMPESVRKEGFAPPQRTMNKRKVFYGITTFFDELLFPEICVICGGSTATEGTAKRTSAVDGNSVRGPVICPKCAKDVVRYTMPNEHPGDIYPFGKLYCYGRYSGALKEAFTRYKFKGEVWMGKRFGKLLYESFGAWFREYSYISYVPVSRDRFRKRGFDQCREMTAEISKLSGIETLRLLEADSGRQKQSRLGFVQRSSNASGKFRVNGDGNREKVAGRKILLIDDILTTGATLRECAELIVDELGALSVDAAVFASGRSDIGRN